MPDGEMPETLRQIILNGLEKPSSAVPLAPGLPTSLEPGNDVCKPLANERDRRKEVDAEIFRQLESIRCTSEANRNTNRRGTIGIGLVLLLAVGEYLGVLGPGDPPIWAKAVIDVAMWILGAK